MAINPQPLVNSGLFKHVLDIYNLKYLPRGTQDFSFKIDFSLETKKKSFFFKLKSLMNPFNQLLTNQNEYSRLEFCVILVNMTSYLWKRKKT